MRRPAIAFLLVLLVLVAFVLRTAGFEDVFLATGEVVFFYADPYYQLRAGLYAMQAFPGFLHQDAYVNFPDGVGAVLPPLFHLLLGGVGRLLGGDVPALERGAAWLGPVVGAATVLPAYGAARVLGGPRTALAAAGFVAVLPVSVLSGRVGNADYHAFLTLVGACWLASLLVAVREGTSRRGRGLAYLGITVARTVVLTAWPGSLAYLGPAEGVLFAAEALRGATGRLAAHAVSLLASLAVVVPLLQASGPPVAGDWSTLSLSWLHATALAGLAVATLLLAALDRLRPSQRIPVRALRAGLVLAVATAAMMAVPAVREGIVAAVGFLGGVDPWVAENFEAKPLFRFDPAGRMVAPVLYGLFGYTIPLLPLVPLFAVRAPGRVVPARALAAWTAPFAALAALQMRYGSEFVVPYAVCLALGLAALSRLAARRLTTPGSRLAVAVLAALSLLPGVLVIHAPALRASAAALVAPPGTGDRALQLPVGTLVRFSEEVRRLTPETSGFLDPSARPEYGILVEPEIGHTLMHVARRPTPAGNFGRFVGATNYDATRRFYATPSEDEAVALSDALRSPFVVTTENGQAGTGAKQILHDADGRAPDGSRFTRFRLVTEGPSGGRALSELFGLPGRTGLPPYKLFQRVSGAVLEAPARPGSTVAAQVVVRAPGGRRFVYRVEGRAGEDGVARLRVPYATETALPARPLGPWRVEREGAEVAEVRVSDAEVLEGSIVRVAP